ncbi:MAG: hypothetical protein JO339_10720 [Alphaproteobacteria bacterium]|nr:hypothetical protein [Alphaproteobacteria bacterium]
MTGYAHGNIPIADHTGGGPDSVIAVYYRLDTARAMIAASFEPDGTEGSVEVACTRLLEHP